MIAAPPLKSELHLDLPDLRAQLEDLMAALEAAVARREFGEFYGVFRRTELPFLPVVYEGQPQPLFHQCFAILHQLGSISPATALAIENHFYVSAAIATFPTDHDPELDRRRHALLAAISNGRWLVANTNSKVHGRTLGTIGTVARRAEDGFCITGQAAYTSLATQGDLLVFMTEIEGEGPAVFAIAPMQRNPGIEIGPYLFPSAMLDSDTRRITFRDLFIPEAGLIAGGAPPKTSALFAFEMAWHQLLIPALYLGAAARAIEEVRRFLRSTVGRDEQPLAELDGMVIDVGRLALEYESACSVVRYAGDKLGAVRRLPSDAEHLERALYLASGAKYTGTRCAEQVVAAARRIIGARAFADGHPLERLSAEVIFGPLGPEVSAVIERRYGRQALADRPFVGVGDQS
jgi:alkylation response protein AidB-like acyl-CoA dehydrogenase